MQKNHFQCEMYKKDLQNKSKGPRATARFCPSIMSPKHPIKACLLPVVRWEKKINASIFSFCFLRSVIEMENQMNGKQIIVLSIFPACPTRVSAEWSWVWDMTRTKCEIEQLGGNKSALTTKSDQHVAAAGSAPFRICPKAVSTKWRIFLSLLSHLTTPSNIIFSIPGCNSRSLAVLLLPLLVGDIERIIEGKAVSPLLFCAERLCVLL